MHLSNDELLELDDVGREHLAQCSQCQVRATNLAKIRNQFQNMPNVEPLSAGWQQIRASYQQELQHKALMAERKKVKFWQMVSGGIAASFILMSAWQYVKLPADQITITSQQALIAQVIQENNEIQQQLINKYAFGPSLEYHRVGIQVELEHIDSKIQKAYLEKLSDQEKLRLWRQRHALLKTALENASQTHILKI